MLKTNKPNKPNVGADASVCPNAKKACPKKIDNRLKQPAAITLVALVITIIILIILAGVSLNIALGQNGIFTKSKQAVDKYKDSAQKEQNEMDNLYNTLVGLTDGGDEPKEPLDLENLEIGNPVEGSAEKYGWKVEGYNVELSEVGCWRLFYQDDTCTYLISDNLINKEDGTGFKPSDYYTTVKKEDNETLKYQSGADVGTVGKRLNKKLLDATDKQFFEGSNTNKNIRATAWLTDPDNELWKKYKNDDAEFAIGSPTVELYAASFDAAAEYENNKPDKTEERTKIGTGLGVDSNGYTEQTSRDQLSKDYNHGIYNKDGSSYWWLASPIDLFGGGNGLDVKGNDGHFGGNSVDSGSYAVRPIVCIQTIVFDEFLNSGKYELIDDKVEQENP